MSRGEHSKGGRSKGPGGGYGKSGGGHTGKGGSHSSGGICGLIAFGGLAVAVLLGSGATYGLYVLIS